MGQENSAPLKRRPGYIYFIEAIGGDAIKIGFTVNSPAGFRLTALRGGNHAELRLLGWLSGTMKMEKAIQRQWDDHKIRGEWFRATGGLREAIGRYIESPAPKVETIRSLACPAASSIVEPTIQDELRLALAEGRHDPDLLIRAAELIDDMIEIVRQIDRREVEHLEAVARNHKSLLRCKGRSPRRQTALERLKEQTDETGSYPYSSL